ncbi:MAG: tetratricopeptide repeat protein [Deltaproteobacteria bacterium]|nr:tetratricopeptide repeat protein [Deltaproteobacteria bacterium]
MEQAVKRNPHSLKAWILLGEEYAKKGNIQGSLKCFESAAEIFPDYEIPYMRTASLLQKLGHKEESMSLFDKCKALTMHLHGAS